MRLRKLALVFAIISLVYCEEDECPRYGVREFFFGDVLPAVEETLDEVSAVNNNFLQRMLEAVSVIEPHVDSEHLKREYFMGVTEKFEERYDFQTSWIGEDIRKHWLALIEEDDKIKKSSDQDATELLKSIQIAKDVVDWAEGKADSLLTDLTETWRHWANMVKEVIENIVKTPDDTQEEIYKKLIEFAEEHFDEFTLITLKKSGTPAGIERPHLKPARERVNQVLLHVKSGVSQNGTRNLDQMWETQVSVIIDGKEPSRKLSRIEINNKFQDLNVLVAHLMAHIIEENWK